MYLLRKTFAWYCQAKNNEKKSQNLKIGIFMSQIYVSMYMNNIKSDKQHYVQDFGDLHGTNITMPIQAFDMK